MFEYIVSLASYKILSEGAQKVKKGFSEYLEFTVQGVFDLFNRSLCLK